MGETRSFGEVARELGVSVAQVRGWAGAVARKVACYEGVAGGTATGCGVTA